jgi:hypothetical protein
MRISKSAPLSSRQCLHVTFARRPFKGPYPCACPIRRPKLGHIAQVHDFLPLAAARGMSVVPSTSLRLFRGELEGAI